mgnify:CR=1 FL=1
MLDDREVYWLICYISNTIKAYKIYFLSNVNIEIQVIIRARFEYTGTPKIRI